MKIRMCSGAVLALYLGVCSVPLNAASIFNFNSDVVLTSTPFTDTVSGLSATFTSPSDPGVFAIHPTFFSTLTGNVLVDQDLTGSLNIAFSSALSNISVLFATASSAPFVLDAFNGATFVGTASVVGVFPAGFTFPEGSLSFTGGSFNRVVLSTTAHDFAIDDLSATVATPEPGSFLTLGLALALIGGYARRRLLSLPASQI